ncbi:penicillin-binding protein 1C [Chitinimonas koreensis]|nr:penicillin-binding protein 1C [Chitinimonas koreensis]
MASERRRRAGFRTAAKYILAFGTASALTGCSPAPPGFDAVRAQWRSSDALIVDRAGRPLQAGRIDPRLRKLGWTPLEQVSPTLLQALLAAEDKRFYEHRGVDGAALVAAALDTAGGEVRGGSTLTMQLAGLLDDELRAAGGRRSVRQKLGQLSAAGRIESGWSKPQILEAYLNLAPFRGELVGIDAASRLLLGKAPAGLDRRDALLLASLLRAPNAAPEAVARRACALAASTASPDAAAATACAPLRAYVLATLAGPPRALPGPDAAPELLARLAPAAGATLRSSLDGDLQRAVRTILRDQLAQLGGRNVRDAAAVVLDNASGEVLAWVGSPGAGGGARFVDGVLAPRQAGSTLKPFLYALAFERGLLTPASPLDDSPVALATPAGQYVPQNYDRSFRGPVSVRSALGASLNVPAVRALLLVGLDDFHARLQALGLPLDRPAAHYGYGLALGAAEVRLIDLANAYRALANGGRAAPWRLTPGPALPGRQALAPAASWLAADILADRGARAAAFGFDNALATPGWSAAKTGTSKDMRDNWAAGFSARHTVAVWVGNADGEPMWDVSGVTGAAPAWREIMLRLADGGGAAAVPAGVERRAIRFQPAIEPPRVEYFIAGTAQDVIELADGRPGPTIVYPADGLIAALDPDIPPARQRMVLRASGSEGLRWQLDGVPLGDVAVALDWSPVPGRHRLALVDAAGRSKDAVRFEVRGALVR